VASILGSSRFPQAALLAALARRGVSAPCARALARSVGERAHRWDAVRDRFTVRLDGPEATARLRRYLATFSPDEQRVLEAQRLWSGTSMKVASPTGVASPRGEGLEGQADVAQQLSTRGLAVEERSTTG
jgi:hypothetical protein